MSMVPFIGSAYEHRSLDVSPQRSVNLYPEIVDNSDAKSKMVLIGTPGSKLHTDMSSDVVGNCRGLAGTAARRTGSLTTRAFGVYGGSFIEFNSENDYVIHGNIGSGNSRISFADTGAYLAMSDGENLWTFKYSDDTLQGVNGIPFERCRGIVWVNNRLVAINEDATEDVVPNYYKFYWSDLNNPRSWNSLSWATTEGSGDSIVAIEKRQGQIWLFGSSSFEVWQGTSNPDSPFARVGGSFGDVGCGAIYSTSAISETIFWLGSSGAGKNIVFASNGTTAKRISTHAIEYAISQAGDTTTDAVGWTYQQNGHTFYVLTFNTVDQTWVYDITTNQWHERASRDAQRDLLHKWEPTYAAFALDKVLVGYGAGPQLLTLDLETYEDYSNSPQATDNKVPIKRIRTSPIYWKDLVLMFHQEFQIDIETGVGLTPNVQGHDPLIMMRFSDDGGHTWSSLQTTTLGKVGAYNVRAKWRRLGRSRERVYEVSISDPVKVIMIGANVKAVAGRN